MVSLVLATAWLFFKEGLGEHPLVLETPTGQAPHGADLGRAQPVRVEAGEARRIDDQLHDLGVA